ncbi:ubiquitin family protein [Lyophyllum atratum]|nr:ubiquitin family protein [Lyophyllum atratum]
MSGTPLHHEPLRTSPQKPVLRLQTSTTLPAGAPSPRRSNKTLLRRFKGFLSRTFKLGKYAKRRKPGPRPMKKPVIYVFSPTDIDVSVAVTLVREMEFTAVYPIVPIQKLPPGGEKIQWDVHTGADGTLVERETGLALSSLYWEANLSPHNLTFRSPRGETHPDPGKWDLSDADSVVLRLSDLTRYLDKALTSLSLHTEARTSFITFWLPSFLNHQHIAVRFIPQAEYSRIAPLEITPVPDVVTRVFMLFKGIRDLDAWPTARRRAYDDVSLWARVVGVDTAAAFNKDLSRVLEWGAMEIPS